MSESQAQNIKVGIFVVGLSLTVLVSVFILGGSSEMLERRYHLEAKWEDVAGLKEGAVVRPQAGTSARSIASTSLTSRNSGTGLHEDHEPLPDRIRQDLSRASTRWCARRQVRLVSWNPFLDGLQDGDLTSRVRRWTSSVPPTRSRTSSPTRPTSRRRLI